jgi:hypothetical protein
MKDEKNPELMVCPFCGSHKVYTKRDVGFDIWPDDEEQDVIEESQHEDICTDCHSSRFRSERVSMKNGALPITVGRWTEYDPNLNAWMGY